MQQRIVRIAGRRFVVGVGDAGRGGRHRCGDGAATRRNGGGDRQTRFGHGGRSVDVFTPVTGAVVYSE